MIRRLILAALGVVAVLVVGTVAFAYWFVSGDGIRRALESQASSWTGQPVRIGATTITLVPRVAVRLSDVQVGDPVKVTLGTVDVATSLSALFDRRIVDGEVAVSNSRLELPLSFSAAVAAPAAGPATEGGFAGSLRVVNIRRIAFNNVRLASRGREVVMSADSALEGEQLTVRSFTAESGLTALKAEGLVRLAPRVDAQFRVTANKLDLDELVAIAAAFREPFGLQARAPARRGSRGRDAAATARIAARVSSETATAGGVDVRQFVTDLLLDGDRVVLSPLSFQFFDGQYQGSLSARLGDTLTATVRSRLTGLDVAQLAAFGGAPDTVSGRLTGAGNFNGEGGDFQAVLRNARGSGTATVAKGTIRRLNLVRTIVLFFGRPAPDTAGATDEFERIDTGFSLSNQVLRADTFSLHSRDAEIVGSGTLNLATTALSGRLDVSLSEELSKQAGTDFARYTREGNRILLPARLGGDLSNPRLTIDAAAAVQRGLRNEVQRRLKGLLDRLSPNQEP